MHPWRIAYWFLTGGLVGFGLVGLLSIGLPFLIVGLGLLIIGFLSVGKQGFWAALISFGGVPIILLIRVMFTSLPACPSQQFTPPPGSTSFSCGSVTIPTSYYVLTAVFGAIVLVGITWPIFQHFRTRHRTG